MPVLLPCDYSVLTLVGQVLVTGREKRLVAAANGKETCLGSSIG